MSSGVNKIYIFGDFRLDEQSGTLWRENEIVPLSPKAAELLALLIRRRGQVVTKQEIFDTVWAGTFVEDGVLTQNIYTLRTTLGPDDEDRQYIETVPRRGYRFTAPCRIEENRTSERTPIADPDHNNVEAGETEQIGDIAVQVDSPSSYRNPVIAITLGLAILFVGFFLARFSPVSFAQLLGWRSSEMKFQRLTDTGDVPYLVISPDGQFAAFGRGKDIHLRDLRSNGEIKLDVETISDIGCLQFSSDSSYIFFGSARNVPGNVWQVSRFGGSKKTVADNVWSGFSLSPDGKTLAFHRNFPNENKWVLVLKDLETGREKELAARNLPEQYYFNGYPAWSPDGKKIVVLVISRTEHFLRLSIVNPDTESEEVVIPQNFRNVEQVLWSADGHSFIASANDGSNFQIWRIDYPSGEAHRITNDLNNYLGISISRDGKRLLSRQRIYYSNIWVSSKNNLGEQKQLTVGTSRNDGLRGLAWLNDENIVYTSNAEKLRDWNLWSVGINGDARHEITFDKVVQDEFPSLASGGRTIYFGSNRSSTAHIWSIGADGENLRQVTDGEAETEIYPQVSPDGGQLYYIQKGQDESSIWRRSLTGDSRSKLTDEKKLSPDSFLSLSPDGRYLAFQNLAANYDGKAGNVKFQVVIIDTQDPQSQRFFDLPLPKLLVRWSAEDKAFDYLVVPPGGGTQIWRQKLVEKTEPVLILNLPKEDIVDFAWSRNGEYLALAGGQNLRDAVLLTDF